MAKIPLPTMGQILKDEFMTPMHLSAYQIAKAIHVPDSRILEIIHDRRKVSMDTSIRLGRYFGVSLLYFYNLQADILKRQLWDLKQAEYEQIKKA